MNLQDISLICSTDCLLAFLQHFKLVLSEKQCDKCKVKCEISKQVSNCVSVSKTTVIDWFNFCREVCILECLTLSTKTGGKGKVVKVDGYFYVVKTI